MSWQSIYWLPSFVSGSISVVLVFYLYRHRRVPLTNTMIWLLASLAVWSWAYVLEINTASLADKLFWARLQWIGVVAAAPLWFVFALQFSGRDRWLTRRNTVILASAPAAALILAQTTQYHHLIWQRFWMDLSGPVPMLAMDRAWGYWVFIVAVSYALIILGTLFLVDAFLRTRRLYRKQLAVILVGVTCPWIGNLLFNLGLSPLPQLDLTPCAFTLSGLAVAWGLFRFKLLDIVPVAREAVVESMGDAVVVLDRWNRVVDLNTSARRLFGLPAEEVIGRPASDLIEDLPVFEERHLDTKGEVLKEIQLGGSHYDLKISLLRHPGGGWIGRLAVFHDITKRKLMEEALREASRFFQNVIDSMPSILMGVDDEGRVNQWNAEARRLTGLGSRETLGQPVAAVFPRLAFQMDAVSECIRLKEARTFEKLSLSIDGQTRFYDLVIYPLTAGGRDGAVIRMDDVTDRTLIEEIMVQAEKMMSVGGLAAGMAHEINNPLGGIIQGVQNIQRRLSPDLAANLGDARECGIDLTRVGEYLTRRKIPHLLEGVLASGQRAARIVANMLEFSRSGRLERTPVSIDLLLDKALELAGSDYDLKKQFDFLHIEVVRQYDANLPKVPCEPGKIEQVLLNLLKNAAQALSSAGETMPDRPRIILRTRRVGDEVSLEIEDNGPGMTEDVRRRVFEPFFTTKPVGAGTGLGLSVSYFIVTKDHRGSLSVESSPGHGAKFIVRLPLAHGD